MALNNNSRVGFAEKISYFITLIAPLSYQFLFRLSFVIIDFATNQLVFVSSSSSLVTD